MTLQTHLQNELRNIGGINLQMSRYDDLAKELRALGFEVFEDEKMALHTTFKIGGAVPILVRVKSKNELMVAAQILRRNFIDFCVLGNGSNILVPDEGIDRVVIKTDCTTPAELRLVDETTIEAFAGVTLIQICKFAQEHRLTGLEFAYGIPARLGGAIYMNAAAYGGQICDVLERIFFLDESGEVCEVLAKEAEFGYRYSMFINSRFCILGATIKLNKDESAKILAKMNEFMAKRKSKQPWEFASAGSVFKRPEGHYAGTLIEECGLKGLSVGSAQVSSKHAGFIVNRGGASFSDVTQLIEKIQEEVWRQKGVKLECEIEILR